MSDAVDRVIASALGTVTRRAQERAAAEAEYGSLYWEIDGDRCYGKTNEAGDGVLTLVRADGAVTRYEVGGVSLEDLV